MRTAGALTYHSPPRPSGVLHSQRNVITIAGYPPERVLPGAIANLSRHDWKQLTAAAFASPRHVNSLDRWIAIARERNPLLTGEQAERLAQLMRTEHFRRMARKSAEVR